MEKTVSINQASLILCIFTIGIKLSALPALMYIYSGNDSYITCLIAVAIDYICTLIIVNIMHKNPDLTFREILRLAFGRIFSIIIQSLLLIYFFLKAVIIIQELHDYFIATLFEDINPLFFLLTLGLLVLYATTKDFRTIGRVIQIVFWPTLIGISFALIFPIKDIQIAKLLPIFEQGLIPIFQGLSRTTFAFGDFTILFAIMGKTTFDGKRPKRHILSYMLATCGFVFNFFVIFVGSFGKFSQSQTLALAELPLHNTTPATIGKLEWLTIIIWTIILLIDALILCIACKSTFDNIFKTFDKNTGSIVITSAIMILVTATYMQLETIIEFAVTPLFASIAGLTQLGFLILIIIAHFILKHKNKRGARIIKKKRIKTC